MFFRLGCLNSKLNKGMPAGNKSVAIMAADVNALTPVLRKNVSDYPSALKLKPPRMQSPKRYATF